VPLRRRGEEDLRLADRVERAPRATGHGPPRGVEVTARARLVILGGRVPRDDLEQVAQAAAMAVPGARQVRDVLDVSRPS
jgi:hypothetical protein